MRTLELIQGTPEWHDHRRGHRNASEAPIMMGASKKATRNELIRLRATGSEKEYSQWVEEVLFARGHAVEAATRPLAEGVIGEELYPVTGESDDGALSASFDGMTMGEDIAWECKQWNAEKAEIVRAGKVPDEDYWQCVQQLCVSGAEKLLYTVSDGTPERFVHCWLKPDPREFAKLLVGWVQFEDDVAAYVPTAPAPVVVADAVEALPAVGVSIGGSLAVTSNLDVFGAKLKVFIAAIDRKPDTDQGFANCEAAVKTLKKAEEALEAAETTALAQIDPVEAMRRTVSNYRELARTTRLALEKVVKHRKDEIRVEIQQKALAGWLSHVTTINTRLGRVRLTVAAPDLASAMKGKKTIEGLRGAVDDTLAKSKIEANQQAEDFAANLKVIDDLTGNAPAALFRDVQDLVSISPEHLPGVIRGRLVEHEAAETVRIERDRERIRKEESERLAREEAARQTAEMKERQKREQVAVVTDTGTRMSSAAIEAAIQRSLPPTLVVATVGVRPKRPTDAEIIDVLAQHYRVHESKVIEWLLEVDLTTASADMAKEFS